MWKKQLLLGCILSLLFSCKEDISYQVKIKLSNLDPQPIYAVFESFDKKQVDTLSYENTKELIIKQNEADFQTLTIFFNNQQQWITVYLEPQKKMLITGDATDPLSIEVKGGRINDRLSEFRKKITPLLKEQQTLLASENNNGQHNENGDHISQLANITHELHFEAEAFIKKYPEEEASAILIKDLFFDLDNPNQMDQLLAELSPDLDDFYVVKDLKSITERAKRTMIGATAPAFKVENIQGELFTDKSFRNRYFIIAFTALWCDMCQTEELLLDEVVSTYPEDSLAVLLISLDEHPEDVRQAIKNDPIQWNIVTDTIGQAVEMLDLYNVNVLPKCFLIDPSGKIMLKTENGNELKLAIDTLIRKTD